MQSLKNANIVVIGGSSGVGLETARLALDAGAQVTITGRDESRLESARAGLGHDVKAWRADATDETSMAELFETIGEIDHVAVLAGVQPVSPITELTVLQLRDAMEQRVWAAAVACRLGALRMRPGGSFTFCSGVSSVRPRRDRSFGAAATAALESFARAAAVDLAPLRVNVLCPGPIDTPVLDRAYGADKPRVVASIAERVPLGRIAHPAEIADAILFLMCNTYVTGTTLVVDGGVLLV